MLTVNHYWPLVLLLGLPFLWSMRRASAVQLSVAQIKSLAIIRSVVLVLLVLALMRPIWNRSGTWVSVVFALDVSESISPEFLKSALEWLEEATEAEPSARHRYIAFAEQAKVVESLDELRTLPVSKNRTGQRFHERRPTGKHPYRASRDDGAPGLLASQPPAFGVSDGRS